MQNEKIIDFEEVKGMTVNDVKFHIKAKENGFKTFKDMKFFDLVAIPSGKNNRELSWNGVYVFIGKDIDSEEEEVKYVGRAKSRTFLERMGGHFDLRDIGGQNNLLKTFAFKNQKTLVEAAKHIRDNYRLVLIRMDSSTDDLFRYVDSFEKLLIVELNSRHNNPDKNNDEEKAVYISNCFKNYIRYKNNISRVKQGVLKEFELKEYSTMSLVQVLDAMEPVYTLKQVKIMLNNNQDDVSEFFWNQSGTGEGLIWERDLKNIIPISNLEKDYRKYIKTLLKTNMKI